MTLFTDAVEALSFTGAIAGDVAGAVTGNLTGQITYPTVAITATTGGTGGGIIADARLLQFVTVTCSVDTKSVTLPTPTPGTIVILRNGTTGYNLRTSAPGTVALNGGTGADVKSAIAASTMVVAICTTATSWQAWNIAAGVVAGVLIAA